ncbi:MAG: hypothetical protein AAF447_00020 [Myxococcota bacterium]
MGRAALAWLALLSLPLGCAAEGASPAGPRGEARVYSLRACPEGSTLDWETFGEPFVRNWCTGCHGSGLEGLMARGGAPEGVNFDEQTGVLNRLELIYNRAADDNDSMPPGGGPSPDERLLLGEWIACERDRAAAPE